MSVPLFNSKSNKLEPCITIIITIIIICIYMQVESMSKVQEEKDEVERLLAEYKEMLDVEKREHTVEVSVLERRNITEKDRLRSEMLRKIRETKLHLLAMTEDQLHATTKRTIMENEQMTSELQYQSRQTERVLTEHNKLVKENKDLKRRIELHTQAQGMLVDRSRGFQNKIKKLSSSIPQHSRGSLEEDLKVEPSDPTRTPPSPPPSALPPPHLVSFPLPIPSCSLAVFPRFPPCFHCILLFLTFFCSSMPHFALFCLPAAWPLIRPQQRQRHPRPGHPAADGQRQWRWQQQQARPPRLGQGATGVCASGGFLHDAGRDQARAAGQ